MLAIVALSVGMLSGSPTAAFASGSSPYAIAAGRGDGEMSGAGGREVRPAVRFSSFAAVGRYGAQELPNDRLPKPVEAETEEEEHSKEQSDSGKAAPTTKQVVEALGRDLTSAPARPGVDVQPLAPLLGRSFLGMTRGGPPDTHMAAGPHDLIIVTNAGVAVRQKDGTLIEPGTPTGVPPTLDQFFAGVTNADLDSFDPRAVFDPYLQRFWVIAAATAEADANPPATPAISRVLIAVSTSDEAAGGWDFFRTDMRREGNTSVNQWCDYPMLGLSFDAIFISCNMYSFPATSTAQFQYAKVRTMTKAQFQTTGCCLFWDSWNLREGTFSSGRSFTIQPATMYGASGPGEFLVNAHGAGGAHSFMQVRHIANAAACCIPNAQASPTWQSFEIPVGAFPSPPTAAQAGPAGVDTGGTRLQYAFWQNGRLSTGQNTGCNDGSGGLDACPAFTEIDVSSYPSSMTLVNDWVFHPTDGTDLYFPAVAPNSAGSKTMVYSRSSSSEHPTAAYIGIPDSTACTGCAELPQATLLAGNAAITCGTAPCKARWGDYHGAAPDPDGTGVWIAGQAMTTLRTSQVGLTRELGDSTPPVTTATLDPLPDDADWHTSLPVTVRLNSTDSGSGPWKISFEGSNGFITNVPPLTTVTASATTVQVNLDGETSIRYRGTDRWGNQEAWKSILVGVDRRPQKIVFSSTRDGNPNGGHELYVMDRDGSNQVRLTNHNGDDNQPVLDRLGRVFFTSNRDGDYEIYRLDRNGSVIQLTTNSGRDVDPAVKYNGSMVAFASDRTGNLEIHTMNSDGTGVSGPINAHPSEDVEPDWSPTNPLSPRLAYVHNDFTGLNDDYNISLTNPGMFLGTPAEDRRPAWGPNGRQVAATLIFQHPETGNLEGDIVVYNADTGGGPVVNLTQEGGFDDSATWSPHGGWIAFHSDRSGNFDIHKMPSTGGTITNLTNSPGEDAEPDWLALDQGFTPGVELPRIDLTVVNKRPFDFHVIIRSGAPYRMQAVQLEMPKTGGMRFLGATGAGVDCFVDGEGMLHCFAGSLEPGEVVDIVVSAVTSRAGVIALRAFTTSANGDPASAIRFVPVAFEEVPTSGVEVRDFRFSPTPLEVVLGGQVRWRFLGPSSGHSVTADGIPLFDSGPRGPGSSFIRPFTSAATYAYHSRLRPGSMLGTIGVPVQIRTANLGGSTVAWASARPPAGLVADVEVKFRPSVDAQWSTWARWRSDERGLAALFEPDRGPGEYAFRARLRQATGDGTTGWSPATILDIP